MAESIGSRLKNAWNVFMNRDPTKTRYVDASIGYMHRPDRARLTRGNERSIITAVFNRIALDVAESDIRHIRLDDNKRFIEEVDSDLNYCLTTEANIDQTGRALIHDLTLSMLDEGVVALVPTETERDPDLYDSMKIYSMRVGKITEWYPKYVRVRLYNELRGRQEEIIVSKKSCAIIENPLYAVVNEPNSTMQRLIRKLSLLDVIDEQSGSGKLDLIIQLPYVIKTPARKKQAEERRADIEQQLAGSKYGIAYTDGTEHITQLNRPVENNLMKQVEYLTDLLLSQLGITQEILDGSADEKTMQNYYNRIVTPILTAITEEMKRKFLSKTARTQRQSIQFFRDPFKLVPVSQIPELADKLTRNEIMTSNEIRQIIGLKPSDDPNADELRNKNLNQKEPEIEPEQTDGDFYERGREIGEQLMKGG